MTGIIWTTSKNYSLGLEYLFNTMVNNYMKIGISPFRRGADFVEFKNNDIWKVINVEEAPRLRYNIAYIDQDIPNSTIVDTILPYCISMPFSGSKYIILNNK